MLRLENFESFEWGCEMKLSFRVIALLLVVSTLCLATASCMGGFQLTRKLYNWNSSMDKWVASIVLFIFIIIPVYGIVGLVDWIILNTVEFYTGSNPVAAGEPVTRTANIDGTQVTMTMHPGEGMNIDIVSIDQNGSQKKVVVRTTEDGLVAHVEENGVDTVIEARQSEDGGLYRTVDGQWEHVDAYEMLAAMDEIPAAGKMRAEFVN